MDKETKAKFITELTIGAVLKLQEYLEQEAGYTREKDRDPELRISREYRFNELKRVITDMILNGTAWKE